MKSSSSQPGQYWIWAVVVILLASVGIAFAAQPTAPAKKSHGFWGTYTAAFESTEEKVTEIQRALEENERLRYENANLRAKLETASFDCREQEASSKTRKIGIKLNDEAGNRVARTLASIAYKPPGTLLPNQLYTLAVTYFKAHEDEKAAVIFSFLTGMEENTAYQTARNYLLTGVAWYRVDNFEMANLYFDKTLKEADTDNNLQFQAQARLWKGLIAQRQGKEPDVQHWLKELVDHHPHSLEAEWINHSTEKEREPANSKK